MGNFLARWGVKTHGNRKVAMELYATLVKQARLPQFYTVYGVEDTIDGRFDMVALHAFLLLERLDACCGGRDVQQQLANILIADMEQCVRDLGVGDMGVARRVKSMAQAFWGRFTVYSEASSVLDLQRAILRNVYRGNGVKEPCAAQLVSYMQRQRQYLLSLANTEVVSGRVVFSGK